MRSGRLPAIRKKKNPAAVTVGKLGGKARANNASRKRLSEIGRRGAAARWKKTRKP
jgi:general stress protein YciG